MRPKLRAWPAPSTAFSAPCAPRRFEKGNGGRNENCYHRRYRFRRTPPRPTPAFPRSPAAPVVHTDRLDPGLLAEAIHGCDAIAHCAGINREIGSQTYRRIHIEGTAQVLEGARRAKGQRILLLSFLRASPDCG